MKGILFLFDSLSNAVEKGWSGCWTRIPSDKSICVKEFGYAWQPEDTRKFGILGAGKEVLCAKTQCEQTGCAALPDKAGDDISLYCRQFFKNRLPVVKDTNRGGCNIYTFRMTCCPK